MSGMTNNGYPNDNAESSNQANMDQTASVSNNNNTNIISTQTASVHYERADRLFTAGAGLLGIIFVWLFYGSYPGISVLLFVMAFYALLIAYTRTRLKKDTVFGWFLCVPVLMLSLTFVFFRNEILMVLNILLLPWLIVLQTILVTGMNSYKWYSPGILADLILGVFGRCIMHLDGPFRILSSAVRSKTGGRGKKSVALRVLAGLAISVPLLLFLLVLLSSADMVFGRLVEKLPQFLESIEMGEVVVKILLALIVFFITFSYAWSIRHGEKFINSATGFVSIKTQEEKKLWDPVVVMTVTVAVDALYIMFVAIQFTYLFGKFGLPEGFTYSEYARSGFAELIIVSLLNMGLLALMLTYSKRGTALMHTIQRALNTIMTCCTLVMLASAYYRMSLYESAYGFTFLRIMTQAFMIFLFVLFVITTARVWSDRIPLLKACIVTAVIAFTVINYINADAVIAAKNLERYYETGKIDVSYFNVLSVDAADELAALAGDNDAVVAAEARKILDRKKERLTKADNWQSFNLSDAYARKKLWRN